MELDYSKIDNELLTALDDFPALEIDRGNIKKKSAFASTSALPSAVTVKEEELKIVKADREIPIVIYRKSSSPSQSAVLWIHGGGYIFGSAYDERAKVIADFCDCTVVSVEYRLAPEHPFPAGPEDCLATLEWLFDNSDSIGIQADKIAIGGASAGAGMAAGVSLMNRDRRNIPLCFQLLLYPMLDNLHDTPSGDIHNHPVWKRSTSFNAWEMYLNGEPGEAASEYAAPSRAESLKGLPPTYISVGSEDLFRDEDIRFWTKTNQRRSSLRNGNFSWDVSRWGEFCSSRESKSAAQPKLSSSPQRRANLVCTIQNSVSPLSRDSHYISSASGPKNI